MIRLYLETNFLMSVCTGRTPKADELLDLGEDVEIVLPIVCFMEAHHGFKGDRIAKIRFKEPFESQIDNIIRHKDAHAQEAARALAAADAALVRYLDDSERRLTDVIERTSARARLITSSREVLARKVHSYRSDPTDDMILGSIIEDASINPLDKMAFFSEDGGFGQPTVAAALCNVGIAHFDAIDPCLAWCRE